MEVNGIGMGDTVHEQKDQHAHTNEETKDNTQYTENKGKNESTGAVPVPLRQRY